MRAFVLTGYGAVSGNVRIAELPDPVAGSGEVLIEIHAASLNPIDFKTVHGDLKRISKYQLPRPFGFDASGIVLAVGAGANQFKPGDAVYARASRDTSSLGRRSPPGAPASVRRPARHRSASPARRSA